MERIVKKFWIEDSGNSTVDWIVLTAGLVLLGAAVMTSLDGSAQSLTGDSVGSAESVPAHTDA